jgi:hypothetical protein
MFQNDSSTFFWSFLAANFPLHCLHMDLVGPITPASISGFKFFMMVIDQFSSFEFVRFLKAKSDALVEFKSLLAIIENQCNQTFKELVSDRGGEFVNKDFLTSRPPKALFISSCLLILRSITALQSAPIGLLLTKHIACCFKAAYLNPIGLKLSTRLSLCPTCFLQVPTQKSCPMNFGPIHHLPYLASSPLVVFPSLLFRNPNAAGS